MQFALTKMTQTWKVLQEMFDRVIRSPLNELDLVAVDTFCSMLLSDHGLIIQGTEIIGNTIQSKNEREALNALKLLDEAMSHCGKPFQMKVGKNRFLNKICPIFQKDFYNDTIPLKSVQNKALDMFLAWSVQYPEQTKIKIAYEQLTKQQGVVHAPVNQIQRIPKENQTTTTPGQRQAESDDVMKLKQLLQSKNPLDVNAANIMIQTMLEKDNRKNRLKTERQEELKKAAGSLQVLDEMLENFVCFSCTDDELQIMKDLFESCMKKQPTILRIAQDVENNDLLQSALEINDKLNDIVELYKKKIDIKITESANVETAPTTTDNSITAPSMPAPAAASILDFNSAEESPSIPISDNNFDDLCSIVWEANPVQTTVATYQEVLEPIKTDESDVATKKSNIMSLYESNTNSNQFDIGITPVQPTPPTLMPMSKPNVSNDEEEKPKDKRAFLDSEMADIINGLKVTLQPNITCDLSMNSSTSNESSDKDAIPSNTEEVELLSLEIEENVTIQHADERTEDCRMRESLNDLVVDIDSICPGPAEPRTVHESKDGVKVIFNFANDHPMNNCMIIVITVLNLANAPITTFQFNASVTEPNYLRILPPSGNELPATKPFRHPTGEITQILLLVNPLKQPLTMECELRYFDGSSKVTKAFDVNNLSYV